MKTRIIIAVCFTLAVLTLAAKAAGPATNSVTLGWKPGVNQMPFTQAIHSSTNAAAPLPWTVIANVPGTQTNLTFLVADIQCYYYVTCISSATNAGVVVTRESDPSNIALDPWPNQSDSLSIK